VTIDDFDIFPVTNFLVKSIELGDCGPFDDCGAILIQPIQAG
jgi:hypothetical protein